MRYILLSYLAVFLFSIAIFILLSFNAGFGYIYIQWHGWQIQTNLLILIVGLFASVAFIYIVWQLLKQIFRRYLQKYQIPKNFYALHPYEQLGILWLLHAEQTEQDHINKTYQRSYLLFPLIRARLALAQKDTVDAKKWLKAQNNPLFELAELLKVDIALLEQDAALALNRLEFLTVQPLSSWLVSIEETYKLELQGKWLQFAEVYPWYLFRSAHHPIFTHEQQHIWLKTLIQQSHLTTTEDWLNFEQWYDKNHQLIQMYDADIKADVLKLMSHHQSFDEVVAPFAEAVLAQRFIPDVLYIWLGKQMKKSAPDLIQMEQQIEVWQQQYPAQPSLTFAQWHLYDRLGKYAEAEQLLALYPQDPYMAYLRLKSQAKTSDILLSDLKLMMKYSKQNFSLEI